MSRVAIVTGSLGLIGAEGVRFLAGQGLQVLGIDNNLRPTFFGKDASNTPNHLRLQSELPTYQHHLHDIRNLSGLKNLFAKHNTEIELILHTAAQP